MQHEALTGIKVLDLSRLLPGPYCSMVLSDHGAEVITIEDKRFEDEAGFPTLVNRNKSHITLNLKTEAGKSVFYKLVESSDVVMEGFRPGVVKKLGVDYETISKINPQIIYCSITGYGQTGPYANRAGHDVNFLAESGVLDLIGEKDNPPSIPGIQVADIAGGSHNAITGILLALIARQKTGRGQYIDISITDGTFALLQLALEFHKESDNTSKRSDSFLSHRYAFYNTYETKDGKHLAVGALEFRFWKPLCEYLGKPEYVMLQYDEEHREAIINDFRNTFKQKTLADWETTLNELDVCVSPIFNMHDVLNSRLLKERNMVIETEDSFGKKATSIGIPVKLSDTPGRIKSPPVTFGSSTVTILRNIGYTDMEIEAFRKNNVI